MIQHQKQQLYLLLFMAFFTHCGGCFYMLTAEQEQLKILLETYHQKFEDSLGSARDASSARCTVLEAQVKVFSQILNGIPTEEKPGLIERIRNLERANVVWSRWVNWALALIQALVIFWFTQQAP